MDDENDVTIVENDISNENTSSKDCPSFSFINTNARSVKPKLEALNDCFVAKDLDLAVITESWLQDGRETEETIDLLKHNYSLGLIIRNRSTRAANGRQYGGVGIVSRSSRLTIKNFQLNNPANFEVIAGVGKIPGVKGKLFCVGCYLPPNIPSSRAKANIDFVSDLLNEAKRLFEGCSILVSGDFNQWGVQDLLDEHPDLAEIEHGYTRDERNIDRSFVNFNRSIVEFGTLEPLDTEESNPSDHRIAWAKAVFEPNPNKHTTYSYLQYCQEGATSFLQDLEVQDWEQVKKAGTTSEKVEAFQSILDNLLNKNFEWKTTKRRKQDKPWINDKVRWLKGKSRKLYDREGRSRRWLNLKKKIVKITKKRAETYMSNVRANMTGPDACRDFFKNVQNYSCREKPPQFDVRDLFPSRSDKEVADTVAEHFNKISSEFDGLRREDIPDAVDLDLPTLTCDEVAKKLRDMKKPRSKVRGDIFPSLINRASAMLATPLTEIYNLITRTGEWPTLWKIEYVTPIPKKQHPDSLDNMRNISCTQFLSKTYESFVLGWLGQQVKLRPNQYGGVKGSGSEHFLIEMWQRAMEGLEDPRAGVLLSSIDYSKAFNRLDFAWCLKALKLKGACRQLIQIVASFLTNREMMVKVGNTLSDPRSVLGGVPQGSLLGVLLFNIAIDCYESASTDIPMFEGGAVNPPSPPETRT